LKNNFHIVILLVSPFIVEVDYREKTKIRLVEHYEKGDFYGCSDIIGNGGNHYIVIESLTAILREGHQTSLLLNGRS